MGKILLQVRMKLTACSKGWEWGGGTTLTTLTQKSDEWYLPFISRVLYRLLPLPCLFTPREASAAFPAFQYFSKSPLNEKCVLKIIVSFSHHTAKGNRKLHSVLTVNIYNTQKSNSRSKIWNYCPCYSKYIRRKQTVWLISRKIVKHKSHSRDFKSTAFSWKKQPGFFLKFLESRL